MHKDGHDTGSLLAQDYELLQSLGPDYTSYKEQVSGLISRLESGRFHLAILGQFKRGKSTFLNALLGDAVLPSSVIPLTAVPTLITYNQEKTVRVKYINGKDDGVFTSDDTTLIRKFVEAYVSEESNPKNKLQVLQVELTWPAEILAKGVVLIDTPGVGSTHKHNTEMTVNFLSQCDAALFLVSSDPPITEIELEFLHQITDAIPRIFFLLNKIDYLNEEDIAVVSEFIRKTLVEKGSISGDVQIYPVSAKQGLTARMEKDPVLWERSGLSEVSDHLVSFLAEEKTSVLATAIRKKAAVVIRDVMMRKALEVRSLELPMSDLQRQLELFRAKVEETRLRQVRTKDILAGDQTRIITWLEEAVVNLRNKAASYFTEKAVAILEQNGYKPDEVHDVIAEEIPDFFEHELRIISHTTEQTVSLVLNEHQRDVDELIRSIRMAASSYFDIPLHETGEKKVWALEHEPYWVARKGWQTMMGILTEGITAKLLPLSIRKGKIVSEVSDNIMQLILHNSENIRWATLQNINMTFLRFHSEFDSDMNRIIEATEGAIETAIRFRTEHAEKTADRLAECKMVLQYIEEREQLYQSDNS